MEAIVKFTLKDGRTFVQPFKEAYHGEESGRYEINGIEVTKNQYDKAVDGLRARSFDTECNYPFIDCD